MKKYLLILLLFVSIPASSQIFYFRSTAFSINTRHYGIWAGWENWEPSNLNITADFNINVVTVHSKVVQTYNLINASNKFYDSDGDINIWFNFVDQDGDQGVLKIIKQNNDQSLNLYIQFDNISWVYKIIPIG